MAAGLLAAILFLSRSKSHPEAPDVSAGITAAPPIATQNLPESSSAQSAAQVIHTPITESKLRILSEILASRNDNDLRMDRDLRNFSPDAKAALQEKYRNLAKEDRNGRGTIAFLLGREIKEPKDLEFLQEVLKEAPCLSMTDCTADMKPAQGADAHQDNGIETTLAYPQLVALHSLSQVLNAQELTGSMRDAAWKIVLEAKGSPIPLLSQKAAELEKKLEKRNLI